MTSFRVKLIGFGPTRLHFLRGYFPMFSHTQRGWGGADYERKQIEIEKKITNYTETESEMRKIKVNKRE